MEKSFFEVSKMDAYRTVIDADKLEGVLDLPDEFKNQQVKVIVIRDVMPKKPKDPARIEAAIKKWTGIIPYTGKTLEDYREEMMKEKYGI